MIVQRTARESNIFGHDYGAGYRSKEGYAVCCNCGARENTDRAARRCGVGVQLSLSATEDDNLQGEVK